MSTFDGLMVDRSNLARLSDAKTRSICSENRTGAKAGGARDVPPVDADGKPTGAATISDVPAPTPPVDPPAPVDPPVPAPAPDPAPQPDPAPAP